MKSENIGKLAAALSKAQGEISFALKDASNPFFKSKYADLESVWSACNEALVKYELSIIQAPDFEGEQMYLSTTLTHSSGEWIQSRCPLLLKTRDPQALGSAITYARRYALAAMVGVVQVDDDGEGAMSRNSKKEEEKSLTSSQKEEIKKLIEESPLAAKQAKKIASYLKLKDILSITPEHFNRTKEALLKAKEENGKTEVA